MALATLSIDLVAQLANLQQGMDKAGRLADKNAALIEARYQRVQGALVGIGAALGAAFSVSQLTQFFRTTVDGLDALNDLADATGASVENLSALEDIAARTGTQVGTVGDAVIKLNKALGEAKPGSDQAAAFKAIGLSAEELKRIDPAEALRRVAVALSGYADDGNKARLVQELFGKSLKEVAPLLNNLAKSGELNAKVTKEQTEEAEKFNQQMAQLQKNVTDAARSLVSDLLPALNQLIAGLRQGGVRGFGDAVGELIGLGKEYYSKRNLVTLAEDLRLLQLQVETAPKGPGKTQLQRELDDKIKAYEDARNQYIQVRGLDKSAPEFRASQNYGDTRASLPGLGKPTKAEAKPQRAEPFAFKLDDTTAAALKRLENTDAQKIAALRLELQALLEIRQGAGAGSVDEAILDVEDALNKLTPAGQAAAAAAERLNTILAQTPTNQMQAVLADIELINRAFEGAPEKAEQWAEAIRVATASLSKGTEDATVQISEFVQQAARNIQDALGDSVLATIEGNANSIEDIWKNMLKRLVAQAAAAQLGKYLLGDQYGSAGQVGGAAGTFIEFLKGLGGGARATGGPIYAGRPYLVGELGPEVVVPRSSGTVVPNNALAASGGGGSNFTINVQGDASENTVRLIRAAIAQYEARQMTRGRA